MPLLAVVGLLFVKPPSIAHNNLLPTSSTQATITNSATSSTLSPAPNIGGKGGDDEHEGKEHEGREHEGRERHGDDDGGRLPKPPSNH